ncbi:pseudaminic acid synthase [Methanococcus voltae]|uniref:Pseudaminic acid synthase n=1 Tax=Methanococcus voltae TaxID=2188 RepID=A0A8J7RM71_METVO|nr:pseudaminic acid synthase [Methanococcus voltae]MBP2201426.1 pseudaminic acid synthase [Methanococcus voltae]
MKDIKIGKKIIGANEPVFIIAEISGNHNHDFERAKLLIDKAAEASVDAVKMQTYTPETMTINSHMEDFMVKGKKEWEGKNLYELYGWAYTPWDWQPLLKEYAESKGLIWFSTPFDETSVDFLEELNVQLYKVASFEITDIPLLKKIAKTGKPVILSRGMASIEEIEEAIRTLKENGTNDIILLHCVSSYPAKYEEMNLKTISDIPERFEVLAGLSDHSLGLVAPILSVAMGAVAIEKHFTLLREDGGPDASFSLEATELAELVNNVRNAELAIGKVNYQLTEDELKNRAFRRSIYVTNDIKKGDIFSTENIRVIRPGYGLEPKYYEELLGKQSSRDIEKGNPITKEDFYESQ